MIYVIEAIIEIMLTLVKKGFVCIEIEGEEKIVDNVKLETVYDDDKIKIILILYYQGDEIDTIDLERILEVETL